MEYYKRKMPCIFENMYSTVVLPLTNICKYRIIICEKLYDLYWHTTNSCEGQFLISALLLHFMDYSLSQVIASVTFDDF